MYRIGWALALTGVVVVAAGWWFDWDWSRTFTITRDWLEQSFSASKNSDGSGGGGALISKFGKGVEQGKEAVEEFLNKAIDKQKEAAISTVFEAKNSLVSQAQQQAVTVLESLEETIGINTNSEDVGLSPINSAFLVIIVAKADSDVSFLLKNNAERDSSYHIEWGDGKSADGIIASGQEKLISHSWYIVGDYIVVFSKKEFLVRVIK